MFDITGEFKRQLEVITRLEWVTTISKELLIRYLESIAFELTDDGGDVIRFRGSEGITIEFHLTDESSFFPQLVRTSSSLAFNEALAAVPAGKETVISEEAYFIERKLPFIPAYLREFATALSLPAVPKPVTRQDILGLVHCHSNWSDGSHTIEELADACITSNLEYLVLSDHSKSAFYANGLNETRILEQHQHIDTLNKKLAPFRIFKSIECDILNDGSLDYPDHVLESFDLVITSIHANLKMTEEKAMTRLLGAIKNPFTTILGHMTGRLLLSRNGYPVDYKTIIDACAAHHVVIELNAHPRRLDMDWRWIGYALEKGVLISIDPDAHYITGFDDLRYGVLSAQKAGVTKAHNLSSYSLAEFEQYLEKTRRLKRGVETV